MNCFLMDENVIHEISKESEKGKIWFRYKYNPFVSTPVFLRNINDGSWNFEFGFNVSFI